MKMPKKMSSFELNFIEKNASKNLDNVPLTNNLEKTSFPKNNMRMSTIDSNNMNAINNLDKDDSFPSGHKVGPKKSVYHSFQSSMKLYNMKLSRSKLKAVTRTSALLSGFAMVAMVELGLDYSDYFEALKQQNEHMFSLSQKTNSTNMTSSSKNDIEMQKYLVPDSILVFYSLVTCLLVGVHMLALMISTCILPQLEASSYEHIELEQQLYRHELNFLNQTNILSQTLDTKRTPVLNNPMDDTFFTKKNDVTQYDAQIVFPYHKFHNFIETAWISSTVIGIFLFLVEIGLVVYIKFYPISKLAALTGAIVMTPILILFIIFTVVFYKRLADFKLSTTKTIVNQLEKNSLPLHDHVI